MIVKHKDVWVENEKFSIEYLISVKDYQLEISKGKIVIGISYFPNYPISLEEAELVIKKHSLALRKEIEIIISENQEFYQRFQPEANFTEYKLFCGRNISGEVIAYSSGASLYLKKVD
jgi:hypothetical protein